MSIQQYSELKRVGQEQMEKKDCTVIALALLTDVEYKVAHRTMKLAGRKNRCGARNGTARKVLSKQRKITAWPVDAKTALTLARELPAKGLFLVEMTGHVAAFINGELCDWTEGKRKKIIAVYRINI
jgi:hypothetical protein